eukprot:5018639-Pleurochrysis_carterae.AAC.4
MHTCEEGDCFGRYIGHAPTIRSGKTLIISTEAITFLLSFHFKTIGCALSSGVTRNSLLALERGAVLPNVREWLTTCDSDLQTTSPCDAHISSSRAVASALLSI